MIVSFFLSDYGLLLGGQAVIAAVVGLWLIGALLVKGRDLSVRRYIPAYTSALGILLVLNAIAGIGFNFVVFVPIIAYIVFSLVETKHAEAQLERIALWTLYVVICPVVAAEVAVKLDLIDFALLRDLIVNSGTGRLDVLRVKSPFGSPLSLASLCFCLIFYFTYFTERKKEIPVLLILLIMTGSRTALAASVVLLLGRFTTRRLAGGWDQPINIPKALAIGVSTVALLAGAAFYLDRIGMGSSVERVLSLQSYNITTDESFLARGITTLSAFSQVMSDLPRSLFLGQIDRAISDSAFASIAAQSGIITAVAFFSLFYFYGSKLRIGMLDKAMFLGFFTFLAAMMGDAVVPLITFFYFLIFYTHAREPGVAAAEEAAHLEASRPSAREA